MQRRGQCKFYAQGRCLKGESCEFAHEVEMAPPKKACAFYQRGTCTFGSRCRFEHSNSSRVESSASSSSLARVPTTSNHSPGDSATGTAQNRSFFAVLSDQSIQNVPPVKPDIHAGESAEDGGNDRMICSLSADGNCPLGETCSDIHGDLCSACGKYCLHPFKPEDREKHGNECEKKQALERSQEIECSVCLERVLSKTSAFERKFGLLSECDHAFCITCIRKWRSCSSDPETEVDSAARACPVCRKLSYYVIPSLIWYSSREEKQEIINKYKAKLKSIDCMYFNFGNGYCRHGSSCFYKHEVKAGSSRRNRSSNANYRHNNRQHRGRSDDAPLGFEEFADMAEVYAMLDLFEAMFFLDDEDAIGDGESDDEMPESFQFTDLFEELPRLGMSCSGDYDDDKGPLKPWQREIFYAETGYYDYDDYTDITRYDSDWNYIG